MRKVLLIIWAWQVCMLLMQADSSPTSNSHTQAISSKESSSKETFSKKTPTKDNLPKDHLPTDTSPTYQLEQDELPESLQNNLLLQAPAEKNAPINPKTKYIQLANNLPIYILPAYYSFTPPYSRNDIPVEMKFQVSFRVVFLEQLVCKYCNFDFAYTQTHWFQIYNTKDSKPMRDINFSPSFMFNYYKQLPFLGGYITTMRLGYIHLSNGERRDNLVVGEADIRNEGLNKDDPNWLRRSKSIDRFIAQIDWQRGRFGLSLRAWVPVGRHFISDKGDNDNLTSYIGFGDIAFSYEYKRHLFELYVNNIFNNYFSKDYWDWKGRVELGYTYRLSKRVGVYFQVIHGFGDSLYEFNYSLTRAGSGLRLNF